MTVTEETRHRAVAYHEAGHAVALLSLGGNVETCWIGEVGIEDGSCEPVAGIAAQPRERLFFLVSGWLSELCVDGFATIPESDAAPIRQMFNESKCDLITMVDEFYRAARRSAETITTEKAAIDAIAAALVEKGTLSRGEVDALWSRHRSTHD